MPITLADLILAGLVLLLTSVATRNFPAVLEIAVLQRLPMDAGSRYATTTISRYVITAIGVVVAFGVIGLGWSQIQWLVAALGVGLGFGLQEIFANFISGLIILFERPIRVGDTVTVGDVSGTVSRIRIRATTITDWDRKELIVPNKEFITGQLINWTLSDPITRITVKVGIAYGSDTALAHRVMLETAQANERVLESPRPKIFFVGFGDSSLDFEIRVYVRSVEERFAVIHELHMAIDQGLRKHGIEIPFPQRDLHLRSAEAPVILAGSDRLEAKTSAKEDNQAARQEKT
jgi:potassium efflux system protein